jgi:preprotein translocase subunit SecD
MAMKARNRGPVRTLTVLGLLLVLLFGGLGAAAVWGTPKAALTPLLGLDLAGGRQIVIEPVVEGAAEVGPEQVDQAIDIIRQRVDGTGVAEAEVSRLGGTNISVSIPGDPSPAQLEALSRSSQLRFRTVLVSAPVSELPTAPADPTRNLPLPTGNPEEPPSVDLPGESPTDGPTSSDPAATTDGAYPEGLLAAGSTSSPTGTGDPDGPASPTGDTDEGTATAAPTDPAVTPTDPAAAPTDASDLAWITPELQEQFVALDCADPEVTQDSAVADPAAPIVACSVGGLEKYILGPSELSGAELEDASSGLELAQGGSPTGRVEVRLSLDGKGTETFREITTRAMGFPPNSDQNRFAMVLDGQVISAPGVNSVISDGNASIAGGFTNESAETLANQLKFGALPISFAVQTSEQISPTLGGEQLRLGLIAGVIGLALVFLYSVVQYRALGLVTVGSLAIAASAAYGLVTLLGWTNNYRLTMAGVTGLIVAIGITADSFIVYFERIRDEVRAGRPLRFAVDTGWQRARRTILISDAVNLLAAGVLYWLSESGVRAFAFALGLTTVIDLIVVMMFTHPVVSMLANTTFFGEGHRWSGMDPESLGAKRSTYLGRGQFAAPEPTGRRGHTREELEGGVV